jgi:hypothetical protein
MEKPECHRANLESTEGKLERKDTAREQRTVDSQKTVFTLHVSVEDSIGSIRRGK